VHKLKWSNDDVEVDKQQLEEVKRISTQEANQIAAAFNEEGGGPSQG